jgi:hypothetical protein
VCGPRVTASLGVAWDADESASGPKGLRPMSVARIGTVLTVVSVLAASMLAGCGEQNDTDSSSSSSSSTTPTGASVPSSTPPPTPDLSGLSAAQLSKRSRNALDAARTFHVDVSVAENGQRFAADISYGTVGSHGTMTVGGDKVDILTVDNAFYMRAPDRLWRKKFGAEADRTLAIVSGKWLKLSTTDKQFAEFAEFGSRDGFVRSMLGDWVTKPRKTGHKTVAGVPCIGLTGTDGTLWINKVDARPVQLQSDPDSSTRGRITFSDYNTVTEPKAPPTSTTIDITKLRN